MHPGPRGSRREGMRIEEQGKKRVGVQEDKYSTQSELRQR